MEFDLLLPDKVIIEYNGLTHYRINSPSRKPILTHHDKWKKSVLEKLGYFLIEIPFYRWQDFLNEKDQRKYLIHKIEGELVRKYFGEKVFQKVMNEM